MYRNPKLLKALRDCPCSHCGANDGTIVAAHRNQGKGMGIKVSDALVTPLCYVCHTSLDQGKDLSREERREMWDQAYIRGIQYMIENEILVLNGN
jgi:hypothetical protein